MPRPGPRPYECVRRAWHSDRHQPIRGSIIQQIFRVVTEAHSSTIRKNREWQEKLPRVVLKAEEILYSKANSEAEYVDADTLWDRLNDAINTIIRRDESTETGQFLQPCIEAALVLGCVPVRASRSQRHSNPRSYLNPRFQEPTQASHVIPDKFNNHGPFQKPPPPYDNQLSSPRSGIANQATSFAVPTPTPTTSYTPTQNVHQYQQAFPQPIPSVATESKSALNLGSIYPLYHSTNFSHVESQSRFHSSQNSYSDNIIIGRPVGWPPTCFSTVRNPLPGESVRIADDKNEQVRALDTHGKALEMDCDLSLRLGPSDRCARVNNDGGSSSHVELSLFSRCNSSNPTESRDNRREQGEILDQNTTSRKRKGEDYHELGDRSAQWLPKPQHSQSDGQSRWPVLEEKEKRRFSE